MPNIFLIASPLIPSSPMTLVNVIKINIADIIDSKKKTKEKLARSLHSGEGNKSLRKVANITKEPVHNVVRCLKESNINLTASRFDSLNGTKFS